MNESPLAEPWKPITHRTLDAHAQEIGRLCIYWSELEMYVSLLVNDLLDIQDVTAKNVVFGVLDLRAKLQTLLPMGFAKKPSNEWYANLETVVNHIDNDLRPERNRMIHDMWMSGDSGTDDALRIQVVAKVVNQQARTKVLKLAMMKTIKAEEIGRLYEKIILATQRIAALKSEYEFLSSLETPIGRVLADHGRLGDSPPTPKSPPQSSEE